MYCLTDVRDVAEAHVKLLENPNVYGRYLCCEGSTKQMVIHNSVCGLKIVLKW